MIQTPGLTCRRCGRDRHEAGKIYPGGLCYDCEGAVWAWRLTFVAVLLVVAWYFTCPTTGTHVPVEEVQDGR